MKVLVVCAAKPAAHDSQPKRIPFAEKLRSKYPDWIIDDCHVDDMNPDGYDEIITWDFLIDKIRGRYRHIKIKLAQHYEV